MNEELPIIIRNYLPQDNNFIMNSWLLSSRESFPQRHITKYNYNLNYTPVIKTLMADSIIRVAVDKDNDNWIIGYLVYENIDAFNIIHFIYVKRESRNWGVAKYLIKDSIPSFSNKETLITAMPQKKHNIEQDIFSKYNIVLDPFIINRRMGWTIK